MAGPPQPAALASTQARAATLNRPRGQVVTAPSPNVPRNQPAAVTQAVAGSIFGAPITSGNVARASVDAGKPAPPLPPGASIYGTANSGPRPDGLPGLTPTTPEGGYQVAQPAGSSTSPLNYYMERALTGMSTAAGQSSRELGADLRAQGQTIANQQNATAAGFDAAGQDFNATAPLTAGRFGVGQRLPTAGGPAAPAALTTGQLGPAPTIGQIQNVAGRLGATPQAGAVGNVAGRLGAAPQVGDVGNIQMAPGPGAVMPQLGNQGASNAAQQGMLSRLEGFLDTPEGPSVAEAQLRQSQASNMADLIGAARSGRGGAGQQARALSDAMSLGTGIMSDTAGQLATLRAQEEDMRKNRQLSGIGLGGQMAEAQRGQDIGFRGQNLQGLLGDQSAALQGRGQDLQAAMANQGTQTALEQLQAQTALGARGQNLAALQGDQGTQAQMALGNLDAALAGRGQNLAALQGDQSTALGREGLAAQTALGARGQNLSLLQGNQATALGARGQDVSRELGLANVNLGMRGQDAGVLAADADRQLAAQRMNLDAGLGYGGLANQATGQGLQYLSQANQQGLLGQQMSNDMAQNLMNNYTSMANQERAAQAGVDVVNAQAANSPSFWEQLALNTAGGAASGGAAGLMSLAFSDERAKEDITLDGIKAQLDEHLRSAPGYGYRYRPGFGEDTETDRAGPMAQDLEKSPFGKDIVRLGADGYRRVDTSRLALVNHAALAGMRSELDELKRQLEA